MQWLWLGLSIAIERNHLPFILHNKKLCSILQTKLPVVAFDQYLACQVFSLQPVPVPLITNMASLNG